MWCIVYYVIQSKITITQNILSLVGRKQNVELLFDISLLKSLFRRFCSVLKPVRSEQNGQYFACKFWWISVKLFFFLFGQKMCSYRIVMETIRIIVKAEM